MATLAELEKIIAHIPASALPAVLGAGVRVVQLESVAVAVEAARAKSLAVLAGEQEEIARLQSALAQRQSRHQSAIARLQALHDEIESGGPKAEMPDFNALLDGID